MVANLRSIERALLADRSDVGANTLRASVAAVLAQRAKQLTAAEAEAVIADAEAILVLLSG